MVIKIITPKTLIKILIRMNKLKSLSLRLILNYAQQHPNHSTITIARAIALTQSQ
jgi:hypothetical protein